jgi:hypothetical protein
MLPVWPRSRFDPGRKTHQLWSVPPVEFLASLTAVSKRMKVEPVIDMDQVEKAEPAPLWQGPLQKEDSMGYANFEIHLPSEVLAFLVDLCWRDHKHPRIALVGHAFAQASRLVCALLLPSEVATPAAMFKLAKNAPLSSSTAGSPHVRVLAEAVELVAPFERFYIGDDRRPFRLIFPGDMGNLLDIEDASGYLHGHVIDGFFFGIGLRDFDAPAASQQLAEQVLTLTLTLPNPNPP